MSGIDQSDQMMSYYCPLRKTVRWYSFIDLREDIVKVLVGIEIVDETAPTIGIPMQQEMGFHHLQELPRGDKKKCSQRRRKVCFKDGIRKDTRFYCAAYPDSPPVCLVDCFKRYHSGD